MNCLLKGTKSPYSARGGTTQSPNEFIHVSRSVTESAFTGVGTVREKKPRYSHSRRRDIRFAVLMAHSPSPSPRHGHRLYVAAPGGPSRRSRCAFVARSLHPLAHEHKPRDGDGDRVCASQKSARPRPYRDLSLHVAHLRPGRRDGPLDEVAGGTRRRRRPPKHRHRPPLAHHAR